MAGSHHVRHGTPLFDAVTGFVVGNRNYFEPVLVAVAFICVIVSLPVSRSCESGERLGRPPLV